MIAEKQTANMAEDVDVAQRQEEAWRQEEQELRSTEIQAIGEQEVGQAAMQVDILVDQAQAWCWLGENPEAAGGLEGQLREVLQKIDNLEERVDDLVDKKRIQRKAHQERKC